MVPQFRANPARRRLLVAIVLIALVAGASAILAAYLHQQRPGALAPRTELEAACRKVPTPSKCRATELFDRPTYDVGSCMWSDGACHFVDGGPAA